MEQQNQNRSLVQIMNDHMVMGDLLNQTAGELDQTTEEWLAENSQNLGKKADGYKTAMDILDNAEAFLKAKAKPFIEAAKACSNKRDALKERLEWAMKQLNLDEVKGQDYIFKMQNGADKVVIENEQGLPAKFFKEETNLILQRDLLKAALESGETILGAKLQQVRFGKFKINATTVEPKKVTSKKGKKDEE